MKPKCIVEALARLLQSPCLKTRQALHFQRHNGLLTPLSQKPLLLLILARSYTMPSDPKGPLPTFGRILGYVGQVFSGQLAVKTTNSPLQGFVDTGDTTDEDTNAITHDFKQWFELSRRRRGMYKSQHVLLSLVVSTYRYAPCDLQALNHVTHSLLFSRAPSSSLPQSHASDGPPPPKRPLVRPSPVVRLYHVLLIHSHTWRPVKYHSV